MSVLIKNLLSRSQLLKEFIMRETTARYKGSYLGIAWTLIQPLVMLVIYSFVFSVVFKVKWGNTGSAISKLDFALVTFSGLIVFQIFSETMYRSSSILSANSNFVKRVVFPLEILPTSAAISSLIINVFSIVILIIALLCLNYPIGWHIFFLPVVLIPLIIFTLGMSYIVTTLGAFFKDLSQLMGILLNMLFYISPIFYPISSVPERFQKYMYFNPFTVFIESFRAVTIYNKSLNWQQFLFVSLLSVVVFSIGSIVFTWNKETFSDVI